MPSSATCWHPGEGQPPAPQVELSRPWCLLPLLAPLARSWGTPGAAEPLQTLGPLGASDRMGSVRWLHLGLGRGRGGCGKILARCCVLAPWAGVGMRMRVRGGLPAAPAPWGSPEGQKWGAISSQWGAHPTVQGQAVLSLFTQHPVCAGHRAPGLVGVQPLWGTLVGPPDPDSGSQGGLPRGGDS